MFFLGGAKIAPFTPSQFSSAIISGRSVAAATRAAITVSGYRVVVELVIENFSVWPLINPQAYPVDGKISYPPTPVLPGHRGAMVMHKTSYSIFGSHGTVSWEIPGHERVLIMWDAPFNFNYYSNKLALVFVNRDLHYKSRADEMYDDYINNTSAYFHTSTAPIQRCDDFVCVQGTMGASHHPQIKLYLYPRDTVNMASNVQAYMNQNGIGSVVGY